MSGPIAPFFERYRRALADDRLRSNLLSFQRAYRDARRGAFEHLGAQAALGVAEATFEGQRSLLVAAKTDAIERHEALLDQFERAAEAAGARVHRVASAEAASDLVIRLCRRRDARLVAKGKSMVSEELFLNQALERAGLRVVETDLGEWIVQLAHETPSHMVMPAIHKSRQQVAELMEGEVGRAVSREDIGEMAGIARQQLRSVFAEADVGITGANALIAETGTVMLVTNEGNGRLTSSLPPVHIVLAGWEKLLPTWADAASQLRLLARSGTAQDVTVYTTFITGPDDPERELHIVLVDNGRLALLADPELASALRCIRCAACADVCPPYQVVGGQVFGHVYSGPIGLVTTAFHHGLEAAQGPQSLCVSCNACATVCPVEIPLPAQILEVRRLAAERLGLSPLKRIALTAWSSRGLFQALARVARLLQRPFRRGRSLRLPQPPEFAWRAIPALAPRPASRRLRGADLPGARSGPLAESGARGLTVAYFLQCVSDQLAPEQIESAIRVLRACGARVVVPAGQHCCGLPALDSGAADLARRMARQTVQTLEACEADWIVTAAASCAIALLHDYQRLFRDEPEWQKRAAALASRTLDLVSFLDQVARPRAGALAGAGDAPPLVYHSFCQSRNVLGIAAAAERLLGEVCGLELRELPEAEVCCGFGGSTSLDHPLVAREIVNRKLENVERAGAAWLVSDNPGCLLHLRGAAEARGLPLRVFHLAELLAERLDRLDPARRD